ncbi:uncharacterized protein LOC143297443 [Babylonia areolata]|uniref:uncharacterized protein LOC143297443 n=1 Tax=Babylonia areolata TaxID=304850 RepID=UPI003FD0C50E
MLFVVALMVFMCYTAHSEHTIDVFEVKPSDKPLYYQKKWLKYKCTFIYFAQGQTKEEWRIIMERLNDGTYLKCAIFRTESYLTFENFTVTLTGPGVDVVSHDVTSIGETALKHYETELDRPKRKVSSVDGKFHKKLSRVILMAKIPGDKKTEL